MIQVIHPYTNNKYRYPTKAWYRYAVKFEKKCLFQQQTLVLQWKRKIFSEFICYPQFAGRRREVWRKRRIWTGKWNNFSLLCYVKCCFVEMKFL